MLSNCQLVSFDTLLLSKALARARSPTVKHYEAARLCPLTALPQVQLSPAAKHLEPLLPCHFVSHCRLAVLEQSLATFGNAVLGNPSARPNSRAVMPPTPMLLCHTFGRTTGGVQFRCKERECMDSRSQGNINSWIQAERVDGAGSNTPRFRRPQWLAQVPKMKLARTLSKFWSLPHTRQFDVRLLKSWIDFVKEDA